MAEVYLTRGKIALVDDEDYERVSQFQWYAAPHSKTWRAMTPMMCNGKKKMVYLHRFILNAPDGISIDHKNGNALDNRRDNLRFATTSQNMQNQGPREIPRASQFKGVKKSYRIRRPWRAHIGHNGELIHLGHWASEEEAARAYDSAARRLFGEFAWLNFPSISEEVT